MGGKGAQYIEECLRDTSFVLENLRQVALSDWPSTASEENEEVFAITGTQRSHLLNLIGDGLSALLQLTADESLPGIDDAEDDEIVNTNVEILGVDDDTDDYEVPEKRPRRQERLPWDQVKPAAHEDNDSEEVKEEKRANLKQLLAKICALEEPLPSSYDVLQGKGYFHYGLTSRFQQELCLLLEMCPNFRRKNHLFYAALFQAEPKSWVMRARKLRQWIDGKFCPKFATKSRLPRKSPIFREVSQSGFEPFAPFLAEQYAEPVEFPVAADEKPTLNEAATLYRVKNGKRVFKVPFLNEKPNPNLRFLSSANPLEIFCAKPAFSAQDFYKNKMNMLPAMTIGKVFAVVAMAVSEKPKVEPHRARVVLRTTTPDGDDVDTQMKDMFTLLNSAWGISGQEFFKLTYVLPPGKDQNQYRRKMSKDDHTWMKEAGEEGVEQQLEAVSVEFENTFPAKPRRPFVELEDNAVHNVQFVDDLDFEQVNNVSCLMGDTADTMTIRCIMGEQSYQRFATGCSYGKGPNSGAYTLNQIVRVFIEMFRMFTGLDKRQLTTHVPFFGHWHARVRELYSLKYGYASFLEKVTKQCPHCGKVFKVNKTAQDGGLVFDHIKFCKLEKSNCECGLTFRTAREKRNHMLVSHSGEKYLECSQCNFINKSQKVLDHHFEYFHGYPGREEVCDLCYKSFKCRNHLQVHRFNHENYWCAECRQEFIGRIPFRSHMKKSHAAGFMCHVCSKLCYNRVELNKHVKAAHEDAPYLST